MVRLLFFLLLLICSSCSREESFLIHGDLRFVNASKAYLLEQNELGELVVLDSTDIRGGSFRFHGHVDSPTMMYVQVGRMTPIDVLVENAKINMSGSILLPDEVKVEGSRSHSDFANLQKEMMKMKWEHNNLLIEITNAKKQNDYEGVKSLTKRYNDASERLLQNTQRFVAGNPTSVGAAYFVCVLMQYFDVNKLKDIIVTFDPSIADSPYVKFLNEELALNQKLSVESVAPDFRLPTISGDTVSMADYAGQYLFIDFWASWCEPSEDRRKRIAVSYEKYRKMGFQVLSVSLDREEKAWREAVEKVPYGWTEASDLLYWESPISKMYRVHKIPYGVLIGPDGKVISINPRRYMLEAKLSNIFGY
ncbi:MAG: AhpC/TSA family protein [Paludibacteraceae bacterium]|nr:AhpC/TSA family protein [Paludibacteraceae bacterium]